MTAEASIWPSEAEALAHKQPHDTLRVLGHTWIVVPYGVDPHRVIGQLQMIAAPGTGARSTDPETSHQAARVNRGSHRARVLAAHLAHPDGLSDFQLAELTGLKQTSCGVRRAEMTKLGWFADTGRRGRSDTGSECIIWALTAAGREVAA